MNSSQKHTRFAWRSSECGGGERYLIIGFFCLMMVLRIVYAHRFRFHADEPQHLHIVWAWANGLLPYRDVFDNHGPLFHALCAPVLRGFGERPDILIWMRLTMIPLFVNSLFCVFKIGQSLASNRVGLWAAVFTGFFPRFFFTSMEFRSDDLWTVLWLLAVVLAIRETFTKRSAFFVGFLLGMAFCVTVKSGLFVGAMIFGASCLLAHRWITRRAIDWRLIFARAGLAISGFVIMPLGSLLFFCKQGSLKQLVYCNVTHNLVPHAQKWERLDAHVLWFPVFAVLALWTLVHLKDRAFSSVGKRRMFLVFTAGAYFTALKSFFPTLSRQDDMPFIPLACVCLTLLCVYVAGGINFQMRFRWLSEHSFPVVAALEVLFIAISEPLSHDGTSEQIATLGCVLRATQVTDYVMDPSGEAIFRQRPFYFALETFTAVRIEHGLIQDTTVEDMIRTRTAVVLPHGITKVAKTFTRENYLDVGNDVSIIGKRLIPQNPAGPGSPVLFNIVVENRYSILRNGMEVKAGELDGNTVSGPVFLSAGKHTYLNKTGDYSGICVFWSDAFERGLTPLEKQKYH